MKKNFTYLLLFLLLVLTTACFKKPKTITNSILGTYDGQLVILHNPHIAKNDTLKANLQLILSSVIGYSVQGDTSTIQAASFGNFSYDLDTISFVDQTYPGPPNSTKLHLNGPHLYSWDGTNLEIVGSTDTTIYEYLFKQISKQQ